MQFKIANKEYTLNFGWEFYKEINKEFGLRVNEGGQEINTRQSGLPFMNIGLESYDFDAVAEVIRAATITEIKKPSLINIRREVDEKLSSGSKEYKAFVDELKDAIKKEPRLKAMSELNL